MSAEGGARTGCRRCCFCVFVPLLLVLALALAVLYWQTGYTPEQVWVRLTDPKRPVDASNCMENLRRLSTALSMYMESADAFPPKEVWMDELFRYAKARDVLEEEAWKLFRCPAVSSGYDDKYGYAMNEALSEQLRPLRENEEEWQKAGKTPVLFDSISTGKNAHGSPAKQAPKLGRHDGANFAVFADGHVGRLPKVPSQGE